MEYSTENFKYKDLDYLSLETKVKGKEWIIGTIKMMYLEINIHDILELIQKEEEEIITMFFNLRGKYSIVDKDTQKSFEILDNQHNIYFGNKSEKVIRIEQLQTKSFIIQLPKESFISIVQHAGNSIKHFINLFSEDEFIAFSGINMNINFDIEHCINTILNCSMTENNRAMFLYAKVIELIALQKEAFEKAKDNKSVYLKREYDKERILFARDYLIKNIDIPPSLAELAQIAGINEYKLKRGFKEMFNISVFGYLAQIRLQLALSYLRQNKKTITEIAFELGYSSLQHFSSTFKKHFGVSPNQIR